MVLKIKYIAIDPMYFDQEQTFIGADEMDCENQAADFEEWLGRNHPSGISSIYRTEYTYIKQ